VVKEAIDKILTELARQDDDFGGRVKFLTRISTATMQQPELGRQLVAHFCAMDEDAPESDHMLSLLTSMLDTARMADEGGQRRGAAFLQAMTEAVDLAVEQGQRTLFHRMELGRIWVQLGLQAPPSLEVAAEEVDASDMLPFPGDQAGADALMDGLFDELTKVADDPLELHAYLIETFPTMVPEARGQVVARMIARPEPIHARMICLWLLNPDPSIRLAAAIALADRVAAGTLSSDVAAKMVMLRSWMPDDDGRAAVDKILKDAMRVGFAAGASVAPWTVHSITATLLDGAGAQSAAVAPRSGRSRKVAMVLMKQGHGVKDAFAVPCESATEQRNVVGNLAIHSEALEVPVDWLERALSMALADGLAAGHPPAPGLIEVAELCGFSALRPETVTTEALIASLPEAGNVGDLSERERRKLVAADGSWREGRTVTSWFEESDGAREAMDEARSPQGVDAALWKWLETRRGFWARTIAGTADVLAAAGHRDAKNFAATAMALSEGRGLKRTAVMDGIHEQTVQAWIYDSAKMGGAADSDESSEPRSEPKPERKGELARLLKKACSVAWIDGFLMGVLLAPKSIEPTSWMVMILDRMKRPSDADAIQRFVELVTMHARVIYEQEVCDCDMFTVTMSKRSKAAKLDWAAGFSHACDQYKSSWPAKLTSRKDRAMVKWISDEPAAR